MTELLTDLPHGVLFAEKWVEWLQYKREIKDPYKSPKSAEAKANQLSKYPEDTAIEMINQSIANGWKGVFALKDVKKGEGEKTILHKPTQGQTISTYQPETFDNEDHKNMRKVLKANYESGVFIKDYGDLYSTTLTAKCGMVIPEEVSESITTEVERRAKVKPRNRFEDFTEINVPSEIRDLKLKYWLDVQRKNNRDLSLEL